MSVLDRKELEQSPLADLHAIASELGLEGFRRLRKEELIKAILKDSGDGEDAPELPERDRAAEAEAVVEERDADELDEEEPESRSEEDEDEELDVEREPEPAAEEDIRSGVLDILP